MDEKQPLLSQPQSQQGPQGSWMARPVEINGCPPGLEYLTQIDQILIHQQIELIQMLVGWEANNRYVIKNSMGQQVYFAIEESEVCMRLCCGAHRGFQIHVIDNTNQEVMRIRREFKCCAGCCWCAGADCCSYLLSVEAPVGHVIGYVRQSQSWWRPQFTVMSALEETILTIDGPCCPCQTICCTGDVEFRVNSADGMTEVGSISKQWGGLFKEMFTRADSFGVQFPMDLDVKVKATLMGAVLLIDFMYFEHRKKRR